MHDALAAFAAEARSLTPPGAEILDAHTHLGLDEDGRSLDLPGLLAQLDEIGAGRACVFPLHDPDRRPAYRVPNDRVLAWAGESGGRLVPFCRLDPGDGPVAEGERCLALGARGIKLHPRAQSFAFSDGQADGIFGLAEQAGAPVLIHAGRGMPPIAEGLAAAAHRHPGLVLILAHAGIADQAILAERLGDHPGVLYDTSAYSALDLRALMARVPPERIVFGSDPPYGRPRAGIYFALRCAAAAGYDERALRLMLSGTMTAVLDGGAPAPATAPPRPGPVTLAPPLARIAVYGAMGFGAFMAAGAEAALEAVEMAASVCRDPRPGAAAGALERLGPVFEEVAAGLRRPERAIEAVQVLYMATTLAATEVVAA